MSSFSFANANRIVVGFWSIVVMSFWNTLAYSQDLENILRAKPLEELVSKARQFGNMERGASVFYAPSMSCSRCHSVTETKNRIGPNLATIGENVSDEELAESILNPSQRIRAGYETIKIRDESLQTWVGILVQRTESLIELRDLNGVEHTIPVLEIDSMVKESTSLMPVGLVKGLNSEQQFYDLVRYLIEIRDGGISRAKDFEHLSKQMTLEVPEYESKIDHARLIRSWNEESLKRGEEIYTRVCANCHGTIEQIGSLPTSLRFAEGKFKNGSDPFSIYSTLTHGMGFMPKQTWMVPSQKYDVIHYIRENYIKDRNQNQYFEVTEQYLNSLPKGDSLGPAPTSLDTWKIADYGPTLTHCYEVPGDKLNIAYKGLAIRLDLGAGGVSQGNQWALYDTDTMRVAAVWSADPNATDRRFIDWRDIQLNGEHGIHPNIVGNVLLRNSNGPGWAKSGSESFVDEQRVVGKDGRMYGPLPRSWVQYLGNFRYRNRVFMNYRVGGSEVMETPYTITLRVSEFADASQLKLESNSLNSFLRYIHFLKEPARSTLKVAEVDPDEQILVQDRQFLLTSKGRLIGIPKTEMVTRWVISKDEIGLVLEPTAEHRSLYVSHCQLEPTLLRYIVSDSGIEALNQYASKIAQQFSLIQMDLSDLFVAPEPAWNQTFQTNIKGMSLTNSPTSENATPEFEIDSIESPETNPWRIPLRFTGLDYFTNGTMAICTWDGDVWTAEIEKIGIEEKVKWRRIASGLYQPLGLKIIDEKIYLACRDQITVLHDLNHDGETDFYQCWNNDHQVTEHFHEFAMGLQADAEGNLYYAKSGRHALSAIVPQHGTLLKVSSTGEKTEIIATGFRAANGVCLNADGSFLVTDQEGFWNPKNRINWVRPSTNGKPPFYGNMFGYLEEGQKSSDEAMEKPLCWITNRFDRSPGELLWIDHPKWGDWTGSLLNLSYGTGKVFLVLHENVDGVDQGGMIQLPFDPFPTGVMRGRIQESSGWLYLCGMFAWAGDATAPGGLYRIRPNQTPRSLPIGLYVLKERIRLEFPIEIDPKSLSKENFSVVAWGLKRSARYGSDHINEHQIQIERVELNAGGKVIDLVLDVQPTWGMEIQYHIATKEGTSLTGTIHNSIYRLGKESKNRDGSISAEPRP